MCKSPKSWRPLSLNHLPETSYTDQSFLQISRELKPSDGNMNKKKLFGMLTLTTQFKVIGICPFVNNCRAFIRIMRNPARNYLARYLLNVRTPREWQSVVRNRLDGDRY